MNLSSSYESTGSDHFQILLDRQMRSTSRLGNIGQLILTLAGDEIEKYIADRLSLPVIQWMSKLQYRHRAIFRTPVWALNPNVKYDLFNVHEVNDDLDIYNLPIHNFDPRKGGLFKVDLYKESDQYTVVFSWHHSLCDARGAECIALFICGVVDELDEGELIPEIKQKPILELLNNARVAKDYLMDKRSWNVSTLIGRKTAKHARPRYQVIDFTDDETRRIDEEAKRHVRFGKSPYYMGGACMAFKQLLSDKGGTFDSLMIPVPQDQRLRGSAKPILSNQVSYLFYRLVASDCQDAGTAAKSISQQMMTQIKERIPHQYGDMMQLFKRLPLPIYNHFSKGPTKGAFASFFFSDTGESLDQLVQKSKSKIKVINAVHLPPPSIYPGCTVVFMRFSNRLKAIIASSDASMTNQESTSFAQYLKSALLE